MASKPLHLLRGETAEELIWTFDRLEPSADPRTELSVQTRGHTLLLKAAGTLHEMELPMEADTVSPITAHYHVKGHKLVVTLRKKPAAVTPEELRQQKLEATADNRANVVAVNVVAEQ